MRHLINGERPDAAGEQLEPPKSVSFGGGTENGDATHPLILQCRAARDRVEVWTILNPWQVDLQQRIKRARIVHELADSELDFEQLIEEQGQLSRAIRAHAWRAKA